MEISKENLEAAVKAYLGVYDGCDDTVGVAIREGLTAAQPYLQAPIEPPSEEEMARAGHVYFQEGTGICAVLNDFVYNRNAALNPPVDPRFSIVERHISQAVEASLKFSGSSIDPWELAHNILAALDKE